MSYPAWAEWLVNMVNFVKTVETINHIVSECNKVAQKKYKPMPDWVGKVDPQGINLK